MTDRHGLSGSTARGFALVLALFMGSWTAGASADVITDWSVIASQRAAAAGMPALRSPITFALVHLAMYDAVVAVEGGFAPYAVTLPVSHPASPEAAAIAAAHAVLVAELPAEQPRLDASRAASLSALPDGPGKANGLVVGRLVAENLVATRRDDGRNATVPYTVGRGVGVWITTPPGFQPALAPFLASVKPFTMTTPRQFRPEGPPALNSDRYAADYNAVKELGGKLSATRTVEQTATGVFWSPSAVTVWPASIRKMALDGSLDLVASARFQAAAFTAMADALIACWDAKYAYNFWRPVTAIRAGDADGNPRTTPDSQWEPFDPTPNFPEYPSGHACLTAAVGYIAQKQFPQRLSIPARNVASGETRTYTDVDTLVNEVVDARMFIGAHFRFANVAGAVIGKRVADQVSQRFFLPVANVRK